MVMTLMIMAVLMVLKEFTVNPNSEVIFEFNTMTARNYKGGTNLVVRNAENNQEIASGYPRWRSLEII